jgi:hypothetical protein
MSPLIYRACVSSVKAVIGIGCPATAAFYSKNELLFAVEAVAILVCAFIWIRRKHVTLPIPRSFDRAVWSLLVVEISMISALFVAFHWHIGGEFVVLAGVLALISSSDLPPAKFSEETIHHLFIGASIFLVTLLVGGDLVDLLGFAGLVLFTEFAMHMFINMLVAEETLGA